MNIQVNHKNSTNSYYPKNLIENTLKEYLQDKLTFDTIIISVWAVGEKRIKKFNQTFRGKNRVTDVLSFTAFPNTIIGILNLGQIVYCPKIVEKQAKTFKQSTDKELALYLQHSIDHLLDEFNSRRVNAKVVDRNRS